MITLVLSVQICVEHLSHQILNQLTCEAKNKIKVDEVEKDTFWKHFETHMGDHPALTEHRANPGSRWHQPIGLFGDDAKYTLAGRKIVILLLSFILQKIERTLACSKYVLNIYFSGSVFSFGKHSATPVQLSIIPR